MDKRQGESVISAQHFGVYCPSGLADTESFYGFTLTRAAFFSFKMRNKSLLSSLLKKAQSLEFSRYKLYLKNSERVLNIWGKEVLLFLADSEKGHLGGLLSM